MEEQVKLLNFHPEGITKYPFIYCEKTENHFHRFRIWLTIESNESSVWYICEECFFSIGGKEISERMNVINEWNEIDRKTEETRNKAIEEWKFHKEINKL